VLSAWCAAALTAGDSTSPKSLGDSQILGIYIQVNGFDIETALLGQAQTKSESVRTLANHIASDHLSVRQLAYSLAGQCKVTIELPGERNLAAVEHGKAMTQLLSQHGEAFDKAFAQHEVAFHRAAIEAVRGTLLPAATCPALKAHFTSVLPALEHHLAQTQALDREIVVHSVDGERGR
jgi:putative membrane protein